MLSSINFFDSRCVRYGNRVKQFAAVLNFYFLDTFTYLSEIFISFLISTFSYFGEQHITFDMADS